MSTTINQQLLTSIVRSSRKISNYRHYLSSQIYRILVNNKIPWMEYNFFGPTKIAESLRAIAAKFDEKIQENAEKVIAKYEPTTKAILEKYGARLKGKTVALMVGGLRPRHVVPAFKDLGMELVSTGYEFAHNDDYKRTTNYIENGTIVYDDVTGYEFEQFVKALKPDIIGAGIKEKYVFQKMVFCCIVVIVACVKYEGRLRKGFE
ncbi:MAG: hypothetical protein HC836_05700 [Richelia sp. RM2_1_2]|nr:hypothetical protein [Richelia sp. RM2_1_2]